MMVRDEARINKKDILFGLKKSFFEISLFMIIINFDLDSNSYFCYSDFSCSLEVTKSESIRIVLNFLVIVVR
jgi:hypothetical protein